MIISRKILRQTLRGGMCLWGCIFCNIIVCQTKCLAGDCKNGRGVLEFENGAYYIGEFANSLPDGIGVMKSSTGATSKGLWKRGNFVVEDGDIQSFHKEAFPDSIFESLEKYGAETISENKGLKRYKNRIFEYVIIMSTAIATVITLLSDSANIFDFINRRGKR